jgi:hypothetical protein
MVRHGRKMKDNDVVAFFSDEQTEVSREEVRLPKYKPNRVLAGNVCPLTGKVAVLHHPSKNFKIETTRSIPISRRTKPVVDVVAAVKGTTIDPAIA